MKYVFLYLYLHATESHDKKLQILQLLMLIWTLKLLEISFLD